MECSRRSSTSLPASSLTEGRFIPSRIDGAIEYSWMEGIYDQKVTAKSVAEFEKHLARLHGAMHSRTTLSVEEESVLSKVLKVIWRRSCIEKEITRKFLTGKAEEFLCIPIQELKKYICMKRAGDKISACLLKIAKKILENRIVQFQNCYNTYIADVKYYVYTTKQALLTDPEDTRLCRMHDIAKSMLHAWVEAAPHHALENAVKTFINPLFRRKYPEKQKNPLFQYVRRPIPTPPAERTLNPAYYKEAGLFVFGWDKRQYIRLRHASSEHPQTDVLPLVPSKDK